MTLDLPQLVLPGQLALARTGTQDVPRQEPRYPTVLVADPPWQFQDSLPGKRGAEHKYPCMAIEELCQLRLPPIGANAVLFLWKMAAMPAEALRLARAWGFVPKSELVWLKTTKGGKQAFGCGHYTRQSHEVCMIATRGSAMPEARDVRSVFDAKVGRHSAKPAKFYELVERMYPHSEKFEVFSRRQREGWTCWGNDVEGGESTTIPFGLFALENV